jgi:hypothetical protein
MGSDSVVARATPGGDLHTVSARSVFDRELELGRLAALRGGGKLGPVAARIEQDAYTRDKPQFVTQRRSELRAVMTWACVSIPKVKLNPGELDAEEQADRQRRPEELRDASGGNHPPPRADSEPWSPSSAERPQAPSIRTRRPRDTPTFPRRSGRAPKSSPRRCWPEVEKLGRR